VEKDNECFIGILKQQIIRNKFLNETHNIRQRE